MAKKKTTPTGSAHGGGEGHGYPRPQLVRDNWTSLNGTWQFAIDAQSAWRQPQQVRWDRQIVVPFAPETPASGVHQTGFFKACWYQRAFRTPVLADGQRLLLHFGAVDWHATVWVNGRRAVEHDGGYTPFFADITDLLDEGEEQSIVVRAEDDPHDMAKPRGKQDWRESPHSIWYARTTGIWQTVWLETVPCNWISHLRWMSSVERWQIELVAEVAGPARDDLLLRVELEHEEKVLASDACRLTGGRLQRIIQLEDPGIDSARNDLLWSPSRPRLIQAKLELTDGDGNAIDSVRSYTAMRSIAIHEDRILLNSRPCYLRLVLDQGYWPDTGLTAPDDDALRRDVELARAMGFNGVRKHQKIEDPRYLYWADVLGLLVWEEMPSPYAFSPSSIERLTRSWMAAIHRDISHPCIIAWVPFNESWGVPDLPHVVEQQHFVSSIYHLTRALDPSRPVIGNDGWESVISDILGIHDYDTNPQSLTERYADADSQLGEILQRQRPGKRALVLADLAGHVQLPLMLTEFGGIAWSKDKAAWGYSRVSSSEELARRYAELLEAVRGLPRFVGFCYTQFTDTYQEANGLLRMDRSPKFPLEQMAIATRGAQTPDEKKLLDKLRKPS